MNFYFVSYCLYIDVLTLQSFSERLQESFELHFLHRSQNVSCVQSFPLRFHGKVVRTVTRLTERRAIVLFKEWRDGSFLKSTEETQTLLRCHLNQTEFYGLVPTDSYQDVAYNTNTLAAWEMALLASLDTFTPSGSCWGNKRCGGVYLKAAEHQQHVIRKHRPAEERHLVTQTNNIWT